MKKLITAILCLFAFISTVKAQQYYCQPYYGDNKIRVYTTTNPVATMPTYTIDLSTDVSAAFGETNDGPNDVVFYGNKMFVSFDLGDNTGGVLVYNLSDVLPTRDATAPTVIKPQLTNGKGLPCEGITINPATGDLFIPTVYTGNSDAGVYQYTAASNYATGTQFSSYYNDNSVAVVCANLAFDANGNMWMTTWDESDNASQHYLICYKGLDKNNYYKITNMATAAYSATNTSGAVTTGLNLLSAPEGIAFDPSGNLWLGNNNDFALTNGAGQGTLVEFPASYISTLLASPSTGESAGNPTYSPSATQVNIKYIGGGKEGGLYFNGSAMYLSDQGQNQGSSYTSNGTVWKWDVTTAFNAANFAASGIHTIYPGNGGGALLPSGNATLSALSINQGTLSPTFASGTTSYTASVANSISSLTVTPTEAAAGSTIKVNGTTVASGSASGSIALSVGSNTITTAVTASDGITTDSYTIAVTRASSGAAPQYYCQPYYGDDKIRIYTTSNPVASSPAYTVDVSADVTAAWGVTTTGPNDVVFYKNKMFVSFDLGDRGGVLVYNLTDVLPARDGTAPMVLRPQTANGLQTAGMAINPATGDLYVATFNDGEGDDSGVYMFSAASNYTTATQFSSFMNDESVAQVCANLAFDASGNLWMTTWTEDDNATDHFLICYKGLNKNNFYKIVNTATPTYSATAVNGTVTTGLNLLSAPEGIGFDPSGNLWLGNNNDFALTNGAGQGTLDEFTASYITTLLGTPSTGEGAGNPTYSPSAAQVNIKYIQSGKEGGIYFTGSTMYLNDQGQNQGNSYTSNGTVWRWDVTTAFNATNFAASGIHTIYPGNGGGQLLPTGNATLTALAISQGTLSPVFASATASYTASVANGITSLTVTPTAADATAILTVNGTAVTSGSPSASVALAVGANTVTIAVRAGNGITTGSYTITVTRAAAAGNAALSGLVISAGTLTPAFAAATTNYTASVANSVTSITVTPTTSDPAATVTVNGTTVASGSASGAITLSAGSNVITTVVTAVGGGTTQTYTLTVTRAASSNAVLSNLTLSGGVALSPAFKYTTTSYSATVASTVASVTVTPSAADATATIKVNGTTVTSKTASAPITLNLGANTITTVVTAQNGTTKDTYTITIYKGATNTALSNLVLSGGTALSPAFKYTTTSYTATVPNTTASITVTPSVADVNATVTVNGIAVVSKTASSPIALTFGANSITTVVTAQNGGTTETYTVVVTRPASTIATLSGLKLSTGTLSPVFASGTASYITSVAATVTAITVTPTVTANSGATVKVNGTTVASGAASGSITLNPGPNTITTVVTAQDGVTTDTYTITVYMGATNAALSNLALTGGTLSPAFKYTITSYTSSVPNSTTSVTVTPSAADVNATIKVNGTTVVTKTASGPIALAAGANTINVVVTAQNGLVTDTYAITVTRAPSTIATLSAFAINNGTLAPAFATGTNSYTDLVGATAASIKITPTAADPTATIKINGTTVASGATSAAITLNIGANTITTAVTAQDGVTTDTYTLTVYKGAANAALSGLALSGGVALSPAFNYLTTSYTASIANTVTSITETPASADVNATIKVNGIAVTTKTASGAIALAVGTNTITTVVTAQNGYTTDTYTVVVTRASGGADGFDPISVTAPAETPQLSDDGIVVHKGVTPNGDGIEDFLQIDNIGQYPANKLTIMNRNGQLIYEASGYDNSSRVFDGHSNKNGQMQLPGTYFYELDYTVKGITKHKTGFLVLKY